MMKSMTKFNTSVDANTETKTRKPHPHSTHTIHSLNQWLLSALLTGTEDRLLLGDPSLPSSTCATQLSRPSCSCPCASPSNCWSSSASSATTWWTCIRGWCHWRGGCPLHRRRPLHPLLPAPLRCCLMREETPPSHPSDLSKLPSLHPLAASAASSAYPNTRGGQKVMGDGKPDTLQMPMIQVMGPDDDPHFVYRPWTVKDMEDNLNQLPDIVKQWDTFCCWTVVIIPIVQAHHAWTKPPPDDETGSTTAKSTRSEWRCERLLSLAPQSFQWEQWSHWTCPTRGSRGGVGDAFNIERMSNTEPTSPWSRLWYNNSNESNLNNSPVHRTEAMVWGRYSPSYQHQQCPQCLEGCFICGALDHRAKDCPHNDGHYSRGRDAPCGQGMTRPGGGSAGIPLNEMALRPTASKQRSVTPHHTPTQTHIYSMYYSKAYEKFPKFVLSVQYSRLRSYSFRYKTISSPWL